MSEPYFSLPSLSVVANEVPAKFASRPSARSSSVGCPTDSWMVSHRLLGVRMRSFLPALTEGARSFSTASSARLRALLFRLRAGHVLPAALHRRELGGARLELAFHHRGDGERRPDARDRLLDDRALARREELPLAERFEAGGRVLHEAHVLHERPEVEEVLRLVGERHVERIDLHGRSPRALHDRRGREHDGALQRGARRARDRDGAFGGRLRGRAVDARGGGEAPGAVDDDADADAVRLGGADGDDVVLARVDRLGATADDAHVGVARAAALGGVERARHDVVERAIGDGALSGAAEGAVTAARGRQRGEGGAAEERAPGE